MSSSRVPSELLGTRAYPRRKVEGDTPASARCQPRGHNARLPAFERRDNQAVRCVGKIGEQQEIALLAHVHMFHDLVPDGSFAAFAEFAASSPTTVSAVRDDRSRKAACHGRWRVRDTKSPVKRVRVRSVSAWFQEISCRRACLRLGKAVHTRVGFPAPRALVKNFLGSSRCSRVPRFAP